MSIEWAIIHDVMRFGVVLPLFGTSWQDVLGIALRAEDAGYDDVWVSDHLLGIPAPETSVLEGWTTLTALAAATERIGLGTLVLSATFRAPMVAAKSVETLAAVAGPRLTIGLGAGWRRGEHEAFGLTFPPLADRVALVDQAVDALRVRVPEVPLLLGGASDEIVRLAAAKADLWNAPGDRLDELPGLIERLGTECHATRREVAIAARVGLVLESTREKADARVARRESRWARVGLGPLGLVGDTDEVIRRIELHRSLGVGCILIGASPRDLRGGVLERFAESVLPRVRG